ncbi:ESPR-type extended signal peptide-containing protein, partial [Escherichia coli]
MSVWWLQIQGFRMNSLFYRIVFNKARGMLMVVADIARRGRGGNTRRGRCAPAGIIAS